MSNTLNTVLERLRAFGQDKLGELDGRCEEHRGWLKSAVDEVARQIAALGPAAKRQRLDGGGAARATAAAGEGEEEAGERQVGGQTGVTVGCHCESHAIALLVWFACIAWGLEPTPRAPAHGDS